MIRRLSSGGPYEQAYGYSRVVSGPGWAVTAGCTALVDGAVVGAGDPAAQAHQALSTALDWLRRSGFEVSDVVRSRMYVTDAAFCDAVGRVHGEVLGGVRPAATMVVVAALVDPALLVEVELEARRTDAP